MNNTISNTKKLVLIAMFAAVAYAAVFFKVPVVLFLNYEPKDAIIAIGGFLLGPLAAIAITLVTCTVEMVTVSDTGWIGLLMNFISTAAFVGIASLVYHRKKDFTGMVIGLIFGSIAMTVLMLMWNYIITPFYMGVPREKVVEMMLPVFLPFNLIKSGINTALTLMIFIPLANALKKSKLFHGINPSSTEKNKKKSIIAIYSVSGFLIATCAAFILTLKK